MKRISRGNFVLSSLLIVSLYSLNELELCSSLIFPYYKTNRTHCEAVGEKIKPGTHYLDPRNCTIFYCRETHIRHAEIDLYFCLDIDPILFDDLYADCQEKRCDTGDYLNPRYGKRQMEKDRLWRKKKGKKKGSRM